MFYWIKSPQVLKFIGCGVVMIYIFVDPRAARSRSEEAERHCVERRVFYLGGDYAEHGVIIASIE
jgi:hypothetical protein